MRDSMRDGNLRINCEMLAKFCNLLNLNKKSECEMESWFPVLLVPETSASTNSATWAFQERKAVYQKY